MATAPARPISNIAMALAGKSASMSIPKAREGAGHPVGSAHRQMLPTPPNSISPQLAPQSVRSPAMIPGQAVHQPDSDIDLQDAVEHAQAQGHPQALSSAALSGLEVAGAITPGLLSRQHLPDILLHNGPMAIRHVLGHLTQSVPGFSRIPPAKARRIVVSALESKAGGGPNGDVLFEKVGWGRWDARIRGQPPREGRNLAPESLPEGGLLGVSPPASFAGSYQHSNLGGLQVPGNSYGGWGPAGLRDGRSGASWAGESMLSSHDEDMDDAQGPEHELMDKMSLDGRDDSGVSSCSGSPEDVPIKMDDPEDATDEEDWAGIGPEALRRGSVVNSGSHTRRNYNHLSLPSSVTRMKSTPTIPSASIMKASQHPKMGQRHHSFAQPSARSRPSPAGGRSYSGRPTGAAAAAATSASYHPGFAFTVGQEAQEREAAEALLSMGSM